MSKFAPLTSRHPFVTVWRNIHARCYNKKDIAYYRYGGRGIQVCAQWSSFRRFFKDMYPAYRFGLQIDRIDNSGNYEASNCRWVTPAENVRNSSLAKLTVTQVSQIKERLLTKPNQTALAREFGVTPQTICDIKNGRSWQ